MGFKVLLPDINSELARRVVIELEEYPYAALTPKQSLFDWGSAVEVRSYLQKKAPSAVVCIPPDHQPDKTIEAAEIMSTLASACDELSIPLILVSSYWVFGQVYLEKPLKEEDQPGPEDEKGLYYLSLERAATLAKAHMVVRLNRIFDAKKEAILDELIPELLDGKPMVVSDHRYSRPLYSDFIVRTLIAFVQQILCGSDNWGVFHLRSSDRCSEAELLSLLVRALSAELKKDIAMPDMAAKNDDRYRFAGSANLLGHRCTEGFGVQMPSWRAGFRAHIRTWLEEKKTPTPVTPEE